MFPTRCYGTGAIRGRFLLGLPRALQSPTHGPLGARNGAADRGIQRDVLPLVNNTGEISKDHFYPAHMIDAATGAIHIF